jgi:flotillin
VDNSVAVVSILVYLFIILTLLSVYAARVKRIPPNVALIITGRMIVDPETGETHHNRIITGGRVFVWPIVERVDAISLASMNVSFGLKSNTNMQQVEGNAVVKVANDKESIRKVAERFLGKSDDEIKSQIEEVIIVYLRQQLSIGSDEDLQNRVSSLVVNDLENMGFQVDSFAIY